MRRAGRVQEFRDDRAVDRPPSVPPVFWVTIANAMSPS
jgi:hypothetical protein